ncbi:MAG TPA: hypothetical protein VKR22_04455 [Acidimicrobiales bacterium]|nr:hypothetical protein [Acidimicrobiales bacterium]
MNLVLNEQQATELEALLQVTLRELTHEIAATDNPSFRVELVSRRDALSEVQGILGREMHTTVVPVEAGEALEREMARPGD